MRLLSKISLKFVAPILVILFSLSSCTKEDGPVPSSNVGTVDENAIVNDESGFNSQSARTSKEVVGGDDNEDDDDSKDEFGNHR
tara:strand:+ start:1561 stop:1812 length:252 start_codon:yes stop_codon:yes gene_type:complete